uniref:Uncharacterized protein n=1 Tax=Rhizophora mucronata TaxID=61149 RepID=A0A2P2LD59_RHIMU
MLKRVKSVNNSFHVIKEPILLILPSPILLRICMGVMKIGQLEIITAAEPMETIRGNLELVY